MHELQHLHVAIVSCKMSRRTAIVDNYSQTTRYELMQALQHLVIVRDRVTLRVRLHKVMIISFVF